MRSRANVESGTSFAPARPTAVRTRCCVQSYFGVAAPCWARATSMAQSPGYGAIWSVESKSKIERHGSTSEYICDRPGVAMLARVWPPPVSTWSSLHLTTLANITHRDPDILSGSLVFVGTRVPV